MFINNINILYYLLVGVIGIFVGQFIDWCNIRFLEHKKIFSKDLFKEYLNKIKIKYIYILIVIGLYLMILYKYGISITTMKFLTLVPMLLSSFIIDYKETIIPNRLNLTIFETGLIYTFIEGIININIAIDMLLGMIVGAGIFLLITIIGGLIAGKEAMGLGDVKLMGALGLFFGWRMIIVISLVAFVLGAVIGVIVLIMRKNKNIENEYVPFGPFIVVASLIAIYVPFEILFIILLKIFTLGTYEIGG